jgi:hypothetical protein
MGGITRRRFALLASLVVEVMTAATPASATKPDPETDLEQAHRISICRATRPLSYPHPEITTGIAAWKLDDGSHGPDPHAREKDGARCADKTLASPTDECAIDPPASN